ncbi:hypothetical protein ABF87_01225 [Nitrosomonas sp. JL21]|nr:hypothetical protein [Nitrosomonas sp. JL21]
MREYSEPDLSAARPNAAVFRASLTILESARMDTRRIKQANCRASAPLKLLLSKEEFLFDTLA